jgi:exonuclease VII large subunit
LSLSKYSIRALTQVEDHLIFSGSIDGENGNTVMLEPETLEGLFKLPSTVVGTTPVLAPKMLEENTQQQQQQIHQRISDRNAQFFEQEAQRLDDWAEDLKISLERELKDIDRQIKEVRRATSLAVGLQEKLEGQKQIKKLEGNRTQKRRALFEEQDKVDEQRGVLIEELEDKLVQEASLEGIFTIRWSVK